MKTGSRSRGVKDSSPSARVVGSLNPKPPTLGITSGDPAGIGPEVVLKALAAMPRLRPLLIGPRDVFEQEQKRLGTDVDLGLVDDSVESPGRYEYGRPQPRCGSTALLALETGVHYLLKGQIGALVTAPVSKKALRMAGFRWPGQTEFLADRLGSTRYAMLAWTPKFRVVFVTIHEPLARVSQRITAAAVKEKTELLDRFLRDTGVMRPRICVMGFNPHAYEFTLGEEKRIAAGVARARRAGIDAVGPVPADAAVASLAGTGPLDPLTPRPLSFDGFVAMYHDQAMIPAKLLGRDQGVNLTLGLGRIRTSPLHGVAFDIAGHGIASAGSMRSAVRLAQRLRRAASR
jgi:4-hydroxythreonine-4-phosphate dehydrogenase